MFLHSFFKDFSKMYNVFISVALLTKKVMGSFRFYFTQTGPYTQCIKKSFFTKYPLYPFMKSNTKKTKKLEGGVSNAAQPL